MNQTKTLPDAIIFVSSDKAQKNEIVVKPPALPRWRLSNDYLLPIKLAEVIGQPVKAWKVIPEFSYERIVAMQFEVYPDADPLLPIPIIETYPERFIVAMRDFAWHLAKWSARDATQRSWFRAGQVKVCEIISASYRLRLMPDERTAFETCLKYVLAAPGAYG